MPNSLSMAGIAAWEDMNLLYSYTLPVDFVARTPVPPFLACSTPKPAQADSSAFDAQSDELPSDVQFVVSWYLEHLDLIRRAVDAALSPEPEPDSEPVAEFEKLPPMVLSIEQALRWRDEATKQAREAAYALVALYSNRYNWKTRTITPRAVKAVAA